MKPHKHSNSELCLWRPSRSLADGLENKQGVLIFARESVHALIIAISISSEAPALPLVVQLSETRPIASCEGKI